MTVKEFLAQMTDEEVAHLLGGQPNTGVANTFGWGNMPEYWYTELYDGRRTSGTSNRTGVRC